MLLQKAIIFRNRRLFKNFVFKSNFPLVEHYFDFNIDKNKFSIHGVHLQANIPKGLVFFLHGTNHNIQYHISRTEEFLKNNYDVFMIDYPKYGKSRGKLNEEILHQIVDITYQKVREKLQNYAKIILVGRSLGTALASKLAIKINPDKLIMISPYYNMPDLFNHHLKIFPFHNLKLKFKNDEYLPKVNCETYIFHGGKDKLIPIQLAQKLIPYLKNKDNFIELENANHFNVHNQYKFKEMISVILN